MLGFDPRCQFIHEDDVVGALAYAARHRLPGATTPPPTACWRSRRWPRCWASRCCRSCRPGGPRSPRRSCGGSACRSRSRPLRELRFGRGLDNRRLKAAGYAYRYTTREAVLKLRAQQRLRPLLRSGADSYRYEREVEEFLRRSPSVLQGRVPAAVTGDANGPAIQGLRPAQRGGGDRPGRVARRRRPRERLRAYEAAHRARRECSKRWTEGSASRSARAEGSSPGAKD